MKSWQLLTNNGSIKAKNQNNYLFVLVIIAISKRIDRKDQVSRTASHRRLRKIHNKYEKKILFAALEAGSKF